MFNQTEKSIAQIVEYIPRACRDMQLKEAKARLATKIALYIVDGSDAGCSTIPSLGTQQSHKGGILCKRCCSGCL
jgi:translation initiation factor 2B subunit (eIF-2B alpha/beta/delta family)